MELGGLLPALLSLPTRERGLKRALTAIIPPERWSLPTRERGLKPPPCDPDSGHWPVAPHAGAWIETGC